MRNAQISWFILVVALLLILFVSCYRYTGLTPRSVPNGAQEALDDCLTSSADHALREFALQGLRKEQGLNAWVKEGDSKIPSSKDVENGLAALTQNFLDSCEPTLSQGLKLAGKGPVLVRAILRNESVLFEADTAYTISSADGSKVYSRLSTILDSHLDEQYKTALVMAQSHLQGNGVDITDSISRKLDIDVKKSSVGIEIRIADPYYTESDPAVLAFVLS